MGWATVYFSPEHNSAAIQYNFRDCVGLPLDPINHALAMIYNAPGDLGPFLYGAWDGNFVGLVVSEPFGADGDDRILLEFNRIVQCNQDAPELGDWAPKRIPI
jgi:hypothetical protein